MTREELEKKFIELGLPEGAARLAAEEEQQNQKIAWLAGYHFVYRLNERLRFYDDSYAKLIKEGKIKTSESTALMEAGATPGLIADFAYQIALEAYYDVLSQLSDFVAEFGMEELPTWRLVERTADGKETGRRLQGLHELIPY